MSIYDVIDNNRSMEQLLYGVTVGVVTDINDPEKLGRMKVKLINRDSSQYETDYIRMATPMTGKQWGTYFIPEVGDEVLVAFAHGKISKPYVIGSLWNKTNKPVGEIKDKKNDIRKIKTRSGHEIVFNDEKDKESIDIITQGGLELNLNDEKNKITLKDKSGKNICVIDAKKGEITMEAEKKITLSTGGSKLLLDGNSNNIVMESSASLKLKSQRISIESSANIDIKASSMINVNASGPANIKGSIVKIN